MVGSPDVLRIHRVIAGLLAQFPKGLTPPISLARFHAEVKAIKERHPSLFQGLVFSHDPNPWSQDLELILFVMGNSRLLAYSARGEWMIKSALIEAFIKEWAGQFSPEELEILKREGQALAKKIKRGELSPEWAKR